MTGDLAADMAAAGYLVDPGLATALSLATDLDLPLLLEGEPGVGKTSGALAYAGAVGADVLRLQCYEGLGPEQALYEWNYQRQLLAIRLAESSGERMAEERLFTEDYLEARPLLTALRATTPTLLLIDEVDRADDEFEALLLEFLGERSVTIPELGTVHAVGKPVVVLTSNRTRELHDALRRRCLYHWIEYPEPAHVADILRLKVPGAAEPLLRTTAEAVDRIRSLDLDKAPGVAEAIDWLKVLVRLGISDLGQADLEPTVGAVAKTPDDRTTILRAL